jgi:hypothetical protein
MHDESLSELSFLRAEVRRLRAALNQRTPGLSTLLRRRGFNIYKKEPGDDLFIPAKKYINEYYRVLHKYSFRLFLRDVINHQQSLTLEQVTRYASPAVTRQYLDYLLSVKLIKKKGDGFVLTKGPIRSFGETLEWYIAELFRREFGSEAVWGVKFRRPRVGGDYDVIAKFDGLLISIEVKSSPPKQIYDSEIAAFLDRVEDLAPAIAVFLMDTELRMKDKLVPMFEKELRKRYRKPPPVLRVERELFQIQDRIFIINAKESIFRNIETVIGWYYRKTLAAPEGTNEELSKGNTS